MAEVNVPITVSVQVPEHDKWMSVNIVRLPAKGLGPKHLDRLVLDALQHARDELVKKAR